MRYAQTLSAIMAMLATVSVIGGCSAQRSPDRSLNQEAGGASRSGAAAALTPYVPAATMQEIMDSIVDPSADAIWRASGSIVDKQGVHELSPTTDQGWHEVRRHAIRLVEAGNLIAVPGRKVAHGAMTVEDPDPLDVDGIQRRLDTQHDALVGFAGSLRALALQIVAAADRKDSAAMLELGAELDGVCEACHQTFWYPPPSTTSTPK